MKMSPASRSSRKPHFRPRNAKTSSVYQARVESADARTTTHNLVGEVAACQQKVGSLHAFYEAKIGVYSEKLRCLWMPSPSARYPHMVGSINARAPHQLLPSCVRPKGKRRTCVMSLMSRASASGLRVCLSSNVCLSCFVKGVRRFKSSSAQRLIARSSTCPRSSSS